MVALRSEFLLVAWAKRVLADGRPDVIIFHPHYFVSTLDHGEQRLRWPLFLCTISGLARRRARKRPVVL